MRKINFTKMVASGNDFVIIKGHHVTTSRRYQKLAKSICDRKYGVGADGLLVLEKSKIADIKMRIFNADGSEAQMCGNGARCVSLWLKSKIKNQKSKILNIETKAGIIAAQVNSNNVKIRLTDPTQIKLDIPLVVSGRRIKVNFINTGVPHAVIFVAGLDKIDVFNLGRVIRNHKKFAPAGANVDFVEVLGNNSLKIRTYERGVEDETLACGTGSVASALIFSLRAKAKNKINLHTRSREVLKVYFRRTGERFNNVWLEGEARIVYKGEYYV